MRPATVLAVAAAAHAAPLLTGLPVLQHCWPRLAGRGSTGHIALTFDDGPDDRGTPEVLDVLRDAGVRATFFVLGGMVVRHPRVFDRLVGEGHEVGVHSWDHRNHLRHLPHAVHDQLARTVDLVEQRTGTRPQHFRPPYGALTGGALAAARRLGLQTVLWTTWGRDWEEAATAASVARLVEKRLRGGGTVLLHDSDCTSSPNSWRATVAAIPLILKTCDSLGAHVGPLVHHGLA